MSMHSSDWDGAVFQGRFSDGTSAAGRVVDVRLGERGIEIRSPGDAAPLIWPFGALSTSVPIGRHAIDVLVGYAHQPGATLFVAEGVFARRLGELAPHLTTHATRMRHAAPWLWAAAAVALVAGGVWLMELSPARAVARLLPDGARQMLGANVVASMTAGRAVCTAPAGRAALDRLALRLTEAAGAATAFRIVVVDWGLVNAFAAPGERVVLTRGLIEKATSPDEVAGVLAHEMGHGLEMHPEAGIVRALGLTAAADLMLGGSGGAIGNMGVILAQLSYTRGAEREADAHAVRILRGAGISPKGLSDFFHRVEASEGGGGKRPAGTLDILSTHPQSAERAEAIARQPAYPATPALAAAAWADLRAICGAKAKP